MTATSPLRPGEHHAVLALGSNQGKRPAEIAAAIAEIADTDGIRLTAASHLVSSAALKLHGVDETAPRYLNAVVTVATTLSPEALLHQTQTIEDDHGRVRDLRWGDRTLDIDVISYDDMQSDDPALTLPHPRAHERAFVLLPWQSIEPEAVLPGRGPIAEIIPALTDSVQPYPPTADTEAGGESA